MGSTERERDLIQRVRRGDGTAFDELWGAYQRAVWGFVRVRVAGDDDTAEVVQEAAILVWEKVATYDERWSFFTFARYWAGVQILRHYAARKRWQQRHLLVAELSRLGPAGGVEGSGWSPEPVVAPADLPAAAASAEEYGRLLDLTFAGGGEPHQLVSFGFNKLIGGWRPQRIVAELSDLPLQFLVARLERAYQEESRLPAGRVNRSFAPLRETVAGPVGLTRLREYYGRDAAANVADWSYRVGRRVLQAFLRRSRDEG